MKEKKARLSFIKILSVLLIIANCFIGYKYLCEVKLNDNLSSVNNELQVELTKTEHNYQFLSLENQENVETILKLKAEKSTLVDEKKKLITSNKALKKKVRELKKKLANVIVYKSIPNGRKSYMDWECITSRSSPQYRLQTQAITSSSGIRTVNGRYCVALGSYYKGEIGTYFDMVMKNGSVVKCIIADRKADRHTDSSHRQTSDGSVAEFIVNTSSMLQMARSRGDVSYTLNSLKGSIAEIRIYKKGNS